MASSITPSSLNTIAAVSPSRNTAAVRQDVAVSGNSAPQQQAARVEPQQRDSAQEVAQATRDISEYIQTVNRSLQISVDRDLGSTIITVMDKATDEVVRQIPAEEVVALARFLARQQAELGGSELPGRGVLMDQEG